MHFVIPPFRWIIAGLLAAVLAFPSDAAELEEQVRRFAADQQALARAYDLPWSELRLERMEKHFQLWEKKLDQEAFGSLSKQGQIDYLLLRNKIESELTRLSVQRERLEESASLLTFRSVIQELEATRWQMKPLDAKQAAARLSLLPNEVKQVRARLEKTRKAESPKEGSSAAGGAGKLSVSPTLARRTARAVEELRGTLRTWFSFYDGYQPDFAWWVKRPYEEAASSLDGLAKYLREETAGLKGKDEDPLLGDPVGRTGLLRDLQGEFIPYTPEELFQIGERELAWCEAELKRAAKELGEEDWRKAMERVKGDFVPPGDQEELVATLAREATQFVRERELVTVPALCEEVWRVNMISPEGQKSLPYVAYGGQSVLVAYAKEEMKHEDKLMAMRGNNRHFTRITTAHELIPGHHLQAFQAARHHDYRSLFSTPFLVEGWALYWEIRLWDLNFARTPEERMGMLFWRMHRCARIIVSIRFHLGQMQPKEIWLSS